MKLKNFIKYKINHLYKNENGFSIVEMLLVIFIMAIIATVISMLYISSIRSQKDLLNKAGSESNLRVNMYSVAKDIREATSVSGAANNRIIFNSGSDTIEYVLTPSNDGRTYTLNKKVTSGVTTTTKFMMGYITDNNIFSYYLTSTGTALSVPLSAHLSDFKLVNLSFIVNKEPSTPVKAVSLSTMVSLRNR